MLYFMIYLEAQSEHYDIRGRYEKQKRRALCSVNVNAFSEWGKCSQADITIYT